MPGKVPQPWFRESKGGWYVCINGKQHALGKDRERAFRRFHLLMAGEMPGPTQKEEARHQPIPEPRPTLAVGELAYAYLTACRRRLSPNSYRLAKWMVESFAEGR